MADGCEAFARWCEGTAPLYGRLARGVADVPEARPSCNCRYATGAGHGTGGLPLAEERSAVYERRGA